MVATTPPGKSIIFLGTAADGTDTIHTRLRNISPFGISGAGFYLGQYHHYRKNKDTYYYSPSILPKKCQRNVLLTINISILTKPNLDLILEILKMGSIKFSLFSESF